MVKIQINVSEELSIKLGIYRLQNKLDTKADAVVKLCEKGLSNE